VDELTETAFSEEIDLVRNTANSLLAFKHERRSVEEWSKFWGCLDTLRDLDDAVSELLRIKRKPTRVECVGFLQILVSQQDAIHHLSKCVGITKWKPADNDELQIIRDLRNRITSHSAWSDRSNNGVKSTSMINWADIREGGFKAVIYRDNKDINYPLYEDVDFKRFLKINMKHLKSQVTDIIEAMNASEIKLKKKLRDLDWTFIDAKSDGYLREKLWSPWEHNNDRLWQAKSHLDIFFNRLEQTKEFFEENNIFEVYNYNLNALLAGTKKLRDNLINEFPDEDEKLQYYVMLVGLVKLWEEHNESISSLMERIGIKL